VVGYQLGDSFRVSMGLADFYTGSHTECPCELLAATFQVMPPGIGAKVGVARILGNQIKVVAESDFGNALLDRGQTHIGHASLAVARMK